MSTSSPDVPFTTVKLGSMSGTAQQRLQAIGRQLASAPTADPDGIPAIRQVAADSRSPRAQGKVVIITG